MKPPAAHILFYQALQHDRKKGIALHIIYKANIKLLQNLRPFLPKHLQLLPAIPSQ